MKNIQEKVFLIIAVSFATILLLLRQPVPTEQSIWELALPSIQPKKVHKIIVQNAENSFIIEKEEETWMITTPIRYPADSLSIEKVLKIFSQVECHANLKSNPEEYGFHEPKVSLQLFGFDNHRIVLGDSTPTEQGDYIQANDKWCRTKTNISSRIPSTLDEYFLSSILPFRTSNLETIELSSGAIMEKTENEWFVRRPYTIALSIEKVALWLGSIEQVSALSYVHNPSLQTSMSKMIWKTIDTTHHVQWNDQHILHWNDSEVGLQGSPSLIKTLTLPIESLYESHLLSSRFQIKTITHAQFSTISGTVVDIDRDEIFWTLINKPLFLRKQVPYEGVQKTGVLVLFFDDDTKLEYRYTRDEAGIILQYALEDLAILAPLDFLPQ